MMCTPSPAVPWLHTLWYYSRYYQWIDSAIFIAQHGQIDTMRYTYYMSTVTAVAAHLQTRDAISPILNIASYIAASADTITYAVHYNPVMLRKCKTFVHIVNATQHVLIVLMVMGGMYAGDACAGDRSRYAVVLVAYVLFLVQFVLATFAKPKPWAKTQRLQTPVRHKSRNRVCPKKL